MPGTATDEAEIRELIQNWAKAVQSGDLEATIAHHGEDILMFDVPVVSLRGAAEYRESYEGFLGYLGGTGRWEVNDLEVTAGEDVAFATAIVACEGPHERERGEVLTVRLSIGLTKVDGQWTVVHEHHSIATP